MQTATTATIRKPPRITPTMITVLSGEEEEEELGGGEADAPESGEVCEDLDGGGGDDFEEGCEGGRGATFSEGGGGVGEEIALGGGGEKIGDG